MELNPIARLSYLMTGNPNISNLIYRKLTDTGFFASLPFLELMIELTGADKFQLDAISGKFAGRSKYAERLNIDLPLKEKEQIKSRLHEIFDYVGYSGVVAIWALADLIKKTKTPFVFMPVILNYGRDMRMSHQAALLYDREKNMLVFYEPYGTYEKYGIDYTTLFNPLRYILFGQRGKVFTFHPVYGFTEGLQIMIINQNKKTSDVYARDLESIKKRYDSQTDASWRNPDDDNKKFDNSIESIRIIDDVERVAIRNRDKKLLYDAYMLFYKYSAKTCVTLTFIDMFFFSRYGIEIMQKFYKDVESSKYPSKFLIDTFGSILVKTYPKKSEHIIKSLTDMTKPNKKIIRILLP